MTFCCLKYCEENSSGFGSASSALSGSGDDADDGGLFL